MKIDFSQKILTLSGEPMKTEQGEDFSLRNAAVVALDAMTEDVKKLDAKDKYHRGALATRIYGAKEPIKVDVADVALLKEIIGKIYGPHIVHEAWNLLDPQ
ncbi:MAG: hypothetical protein MZV70_36170 [Desulfobacterales bacterium]|nr:hypothetical protein [Desulfobacterales bacterium]